MYRPYIGRIWAIYRPSLISPFPDVDTLRMSNILDQCKSHTTSEINKSLEDNLVNNSSIYFLNIDGNKSNFNNLSVKIARFLQQFSFIGLAETNVGSDAGSVYIYDTGV